MYPLKVNDIIYINSEEKVMDKGLIDQYYPENTAFLLCKKE